MAKIKIAFFAYPHYKCPPNGYGPMQTVITEIVKELSKDDRYDITVYATGDSKLPVKIIPIKESSDILDKSVPDIKIYEFLALGELLKRRNDYDLISTHVGFHILPFAEYVKCPIIANLQGNYNNPHYYKIFREYSQSCNFVTISNYQREYLPNLKYAGTVYHGIDAHVYNYSENEFESNKLCFLGRTDPQKGLADAVEVALATNLDLEIGAKISLTEEASEYFSKKVKPHIDNKKIKFLGEVDLSQKKKLLKTSKALLFPINWDEAFGLVMIEAMACGTPVIAYNRGSVSEIIEDGKTGFVIEKGNIKKMVDATNVINSMSEEEYKKMRQNCRSRFEELFTSEKMVQGYKNIYEKLL